MVWSGIAAKAGPLLDIRAALASARAELVVVSNEEPAELAELRSAVPVRFEEFSLRRYAQVLQEADVIVSPKRLVNGYELGHTEWKITLGMSAGLPAVASPQQSYVEAIEHRGGGIVADGDEEWRVALERLRGASSATSSVAGPGRRCSSAIRRPSSRVSTPSCSGRSREPRAAKAAGAARAA